MRQLKFCSTDEIAREIHVIEFCAKWTRSIHSIVRSHRPWMFGLSCGIPMRYTGTQSGPVYQVINDHRSDDRWEERLIRSIQSDRFGTCMFMSRVMMLQSVNTTSITHPCFYPLLSKTNKRQDSFGGRIHVEFDKANLVSSVPPMISHDLPYHSNNSLSRTTLMHLFLR